MSTDTAASSDKPAIGSLWLMPDGRVIRVDEWVTPTFPDIDEEWCQATVIKRAKGQRRTTQVSLSRFGGVLKPYAEETSDA